MAKEYTVSQLNAYLSGMFADDFLLGNITIVGEVSNYRGRVYGNGIYFDLKDEKSIIKCRIFDLGITPLPAGFKDGSKVVIRGKVRIYEAAGYYQLVCSQVSNVGLGKLYEDFLKLKEELSQMGLFEAEYKRELPSFVRRVGLITAKDSQAEKDFLKNALARDPYIDITVCYATMQGSSAVSSVVSALKSLESKNLDAIVIARGGGSFEDLNCFNDRELAYVVFDYPVPVVSAIGHEGDYTILDYVADLRVSTPTAAAVAVTRDVLDMKRTLDDLLMSLEEAFTSYYDRRREKLENMREKLESSHPGRILEKRETELVNLHDRLEGSLNIYMIGVEKELNRYAGVLEALSPMKKLGLGYSVVTKDNKVISSIHDVASGDDVVIDVSDGCITASVKSVGER